MAFKIDVKDRISTHPGRVTLTPVAGAENTYDMVRADIPIEEGTPVNKALFDSKADTLVEDVTVYVSTTGNDNMGTGEADNPFKTIQKALDALPKNLGGHTAKIEIASGTYAARVRIEGFSGGRLVLGTVGTSITVRGIDIYNSSLVELNILNITRTSIYAGTPLYVSGSNVLIDSGMFINAAEGEVTGVHATNGSRLYCVSGFTLSVSNCTGAAIVADRCSLISVDNLTGENNILGLAATRGGIISYRQNTMTNMWGNNADTGGLILTGKNSSDLSGATLDL